MLQPIKGLATAVSVLLAIAGAAALASAVALFNRASVITDFAASTGTLSDVDGADSLVIASHLVSLVMLIATGVVFIVWQYRYVSNARVLHGRLPLGPGWAIAGWLFPVANLVLPYVQLRRSARVHDNGRAPAIVGGWAVTYVVATMMFTGASADRRSSLSQIDLDTAIDEFSGADRLAGFGMLAYVGAALLAILMVRRLNELQLHRKADSATQPTHDTPST